MLAHSWLQRWASHSFTSAGRPASGRISQPRNEGPGPGSPGAFSEGTLVPASPWGPDKDEGPTWGRQLRQG